MGMTNERSNRRLILTTKSKTYVINTAQLLYIETGNRYCIFHMQKECITIAISISAVEAVVPFSFCRIHRCYIVNCAYVNTIEHFSVTLITGEILPIPEKRYMEISQRIIDIVER